MKKTEVEIGKSSWKGRTTRVNRTREKRAKQEIFKRIQKKKTKNT